MDPRQQHLRAPLRNVRIQIWAATTLGGRKFFVGVGFHRPHIPWFVPQAKLDLYPRESIALPEHPEPPAGMPPVAW